MLEFLKAPVLVLHVSWYTLMTFLMMFSVILLLYLWYYSLFYMWPGIWSVATTWIGFWTWIWSTRHWAGARSSLLISMLEKLSWFHLTSLITMVVLMWKCMGLFLRKNHLLRSWVWPFLLNWIGVLTLLLLLKLARRKVELSSEVWKKIGSFFLLRLLCISINLAYTHVWNTVVTCGLVPLFASWNC